MTNEEIVIQIQQGNRELYLQLWENVRKLIVQEAKKRYYISNGRGGVEVEDLVQCGFLALVEAVNYFDIGSGWKFTTYLGNTLKTEFATAIGYRTSKRDPLNNAISLDAPLDDEDGDGTYYELIEDPTGDFEDKVIERTCLADLRQALEKAVAAIPEDQGEMIRLRYKEGLTVDQVSKTKGMEPKTVRSLEHKALTSLRKPEIRSGLMQFLNDCTPYYYRVGVVAYNATRTSAVEHIAIVREMLTQKYQRENSLA